MIQINLLSILILITRVKKKKKKGLESAFESLYLNKYIHKHLYLLIKYNSNTIIIILPFLNHSFD